MGFDQTSLFLYPPRWKRHSVADSSTEHCSGGAMVIVSAVRNEDHEGPPVLFSDFCCWLVTKGFEIINPDVKYGHFYSAPIKSVLGQDCPEITISTGTEDGEITDIYCRFLLNRDACLNAMRWNAFMQELCNMFHLRIGVSDTESVGAEEFLAVLRRDGHWRDFARQFRWQDQTG